MEPNFKFYFNKKRQWINVFIYDVHPTTFARWESGRWGYFIATWEKPRVGEFGEMHFVRSGLLSKRGFRVDTLVHEIEHAKAEWFWSGGETLTRKNEERFADFTDALARSFIRELKKIEPRIML